MTVHVTIEMDEALKADLEDWAEARGVPLDHLLSDALDAYVRENLDIAEGVARGRRALAAGDVLDHADAIAEFAAMRAEWRQRG